MSSRELQIRPFVRGDAPAIREICVATGRLRPSQAPEPWIFARYWTDYYIRFEPSHLLVAAQGDRVVGYLSSSYDTKGFRKCMRRRILPSLLLRSVLTGAVAHPPSRNFLVKRVSAWAEHESDPPGLLEKFPAHIHIDILKEAQGKGGGTALMERFLAQAREARVPGVHAETLAGNMQGCRFFVKAGFREYARRYPFRKLDPSQAERAVIVYARKI